MKLIGFSVKDYRSIQKAYKLPLSDYTVIVGPNNEGKSNILRALALCLTSLLSNRLSPLRIPASRNLRDIERFDYEWERDYPVNLQTKNPDGKSEFTLEFELSQDELDEFLRKIRIKLTTNLKIKLSINSRRPKIEVLMNGKSKKTLNDKLSKVIEFIDQRILLQYIPAIRTSDLATNIVDVLLSQEFSALESKPEYKEIFESLAKLQQPIIKSISKSLKDTISGFIPDVKDVKVKYRDSYARHLSAWCEIVINDGTETSLQMKGDGIISLTAISLLRYVSNRGAFEKGLILLVEEPESHLHPNAIHNLKTVLYEISKTNQVIITTHSPIMIDRTNINNNIIVQKGKASEAKKIVDIRESLGITLSDNLSSAHLILLVEGEEDQLILNTWLKNKSTIIENALKNGVLAIDHLCGASNLSYKASMYKNMLCNVIAFIDNDEAGQKAIKQAIEKRFICENEYVVCKCPGMNKSELEDLIEYDVYMDMIDTDYGVRLDVKDFKHNKDIWSNRLKVTFGKQGKLWSDKQEMQIKYAVGQKAERIGLQSLNEHKANSIDALVRLIESNLGVKK